MVRVTVEYTVEEVPGKGWVAHAPSIHSTAQGATENEAVANLRELVRRYPDMLLRLLDEAKASGPELDLIPA
jgi:predicted RNase H-like HicB family nuclease